jgi:uncharacterized protein (DUF2147 family)
MAEYKQGVKNMRQLILGVAIAAASATTLAGTGVNGVWRTQAGDDGGYLEITMGPCESDAGRTCGIISRAHGKEGPNPDYENLGKKMVWDMKPDGGSRYTGGKIWHPEKDKIYKSKMQVKGDNLDVEGCVAFICSGQDWVRVK